jgi:hypothetical protein
MQRTPFSGWGKASRLARLRRSVAFGQGANGTTIAVLLLGLLRVAALLQAKSYSVSTTLIVQVEEAGQLEFQNDNVIVKVRLTPGVAVSLWGEKVCTAPADESYIITAPGTYAIPLNQIKQAQKVAGDDEGSVCLQSSDGVLRHSLPVIGGALPTRAMTRVGKSAPQSTWSGRVSIPAVRVSSARTSH